MIGSGELRRGDREEEMVRLAQQGRIEIILDRTYYNTYCQSWQTLSNTTTSCATISSSSLKSSSYMPQMGTVCFLLLGKFDLAYLRDQLIHNATTLADILPNTLEES